MLHSGVNLLSVNLLSVILLNVIWLNVVAQLENEESFLAVSFSSRHKYLQIGTINFLAPRRSA